jgi:hypothetical protein
MQIPASRVNSAEPGSAAPDRRRPSTGGIAQARPATRRERWSRKRSAVNPPRSAANAASISASETPRSSGARNAAPFGTPRAAGSTTPGRGRPDRGGVHARGGRRLRGCRAREERDDRDPEQRQRARPRGPVARLDEPGPRVEGEQVHEEHGPRIGRAAHEHRRGDGAREGHQGQGALPQRLGKHLSERARGHEGDHRDALGEQGVAHARDHARHVRGRDAAAPEDADVARRHLRAHCGPRGSGRPRARGWTTRSAGGSAA